MSEREPGLLKREITPIDDEWVTIREVWDTSAKGCPFVLFEHPGDWFIERTMMVHSLDPVLGDLHAKG